MKSKILSLTLAAAATFALASCDSDWTPALDDSHSGKLQLSSLSLEVDTSEDIVSRASVDVSNYIVKIYNSDDALVEQWTYSAMPEIFSLPVGDYRVDIVSHAVQKADWDAPLYTGSEKFSITDSQITEIGTVTCHFASVKVTIKFSDKLREAMADDVKVVVTANNEGRLEFTPAETRAAYFEYIEGSMTLAARFTGTVKGFAEDFHRVYEDIKAGQHRIITFGLRDEPLEPDRETGTVDPSEGINVSTDIDDENVGGTVGSEEDDLGASDRPGHEDFNDPDPDQPDQPGGGDDQDASSVEFQCALDLSQEHLLTAEVSANSIIDIISKYPIASLVVDIDSSSDDFNTTLIAGGLGTSFDLANPASTALETTLAGFGLPVSGAVKDQTTVKFDVSGLVGLLASFSGTHYFNVTVTDNKGKSFKTALKIRV